MQNFESVLQKELKEIPNSRFVTTNAKHFSIIKKIKNGKVKKLSEFVDEDGIQRGVSPDLKEAYSSFIRTSKTIQVREITFEKCFNRR